MSKKENEKGLASGKRCLAFFLREDYDLKIHVVLLTKYPKAVLRGEIGIRLREIDIRLHVTARADG